MPVAGVTTGELITEAWGDSVAAAITALESSATSDDTRLDALEAADTALDTRLDALEAFDTALGLASGTFTPAFAFVTPGTGSWSHTVQAGFYWRIGPLVFFKGTCTAVVTKGTASGNLQLTGLPVTASSTANSAQRFAVEMQGWTKASYTQVVGGITPGGVAATFRASGSGQLNAALAAGDIPDAGSVSCVFTGFYWT